MKYCILLASLTLLFGCGNDPDTKYPVSYTLDHIDQSDEGHYLVVDADEVSSLATNIGSFGAYKEELKQLTIEFFEIAFNLKEIELLNKDSLRIHYFIDGEEYDTILNYSLIRDSIAIDSVDGGIIDYDKEEDQFVICSVTHVALAGPNILNPGPVYNSYDIEECLPAMTTEGFALKVLEENGFAPLDSIGILVTRQVFK